MAFDKFTDKARKVLVLAQDEARALHQPYVGTEHLLLALIKEKDGLAAQALEQLNVKYEDVVENVRQVVTIDEDADVSGHLSFTPRVKRVLENALREAMQMGQSFINGKLDPVIGRAGEIERVMQILCRRTEEQPAHPGRPGRGQDGHRRGPGAAHRRRSKVPTSCAASDLVTLDVSSSSPAPSTAASSRTA
jgi:ATP-dependent Clp protease ATP-binding subunit ClpA